MKQLTKDHVHELRHNMTDAEKHLWRFLKSKRLSGYKMRRQYVIHPFVVDFVCLKKKIIIELDGSQHAAHRLYDEKRSEFLQLRGYRVLRFWNEEVFKETETVLRTILYALEGR